MLDGIETSISGYSPPRWLPAVGKIAFTIKTARYPDIRSLSGGGLLCACLGPNDDVALAHSIASSCQHFGIRSQNDLASSRQAFFVNNQ